MKWKKLGIIYDPANFRGGYKYGANPVATKLEKGIYRIYFNIRDNENKSYITYLDFDISNYKILSVSSEPVICPGDRGYFDDSGCSLGSIVRISDEIEYIYYVGWNLGITVPWRNSIGIVMHDIKEDTYRKLSDAPVLDRNHVDPLSLSYPYVMLKDNCFHMWYGSNVKWGQGSDMYHVIKYASSSDGILWNRCGEICVEGTNSREYAFARPSVLADNNIFKMWYTFRGDKYRMGYAESYDGKNWTRKDSEVGINISESGFDSEEICYPMVFKDGETIYMLYCGNGYGQTGFGIAKLQESGH